MPSPRSPRRRAGAGSSLTAAGTTDSAVELDADPVRLGQVVTNLLTNAVRHTPSGGTVTVTVAADDASATITVTDEGAGIEGDPERVFERFARSADSGGSGLGLTIARQLVERHGGTLTAGNEPNGGARFTVRLPRGVGDRSVVHFGPIGPVLKDRAAIRTGGCRTTRASPRRRQSPPRRRTGARCR